MAITTSNYTYPSYQVLDSDNPNVRAILLRYLRQWPWFVLSLALALGGAYLYLLYKQPTYQSQASLLILDEKKGNDQSEVLKELQAASPKKVVENEIEILRSAKLMGRVVDKLRLENRYYKRAKWGKRETYNETPVTLVVEQGSPELYEGMLELTFADNHTVKINGQPYPLNQSIQTPYGRLRMLSLRPVTAQTPAVLVRAMSRSAAIASYVQSLDVEPTSKTSSVVQLTLEDGVPAKAAAILNGVISEYNQASLSDKTKTAANTLRFLEERLGAISGELTSVERKVENYKASRGITDLGVQAQSYLLSAQDNDAHLNEVNIQLAALNDLQKYTTSRQNDERNGAPATIGLNDPTLLALINKVADLELQRKELATTTSDQNPLLKRVDSQLKATRANISENISTMKSMLTSSQQGYIAKNNSLESRIRTIPQQERALMDITRQQSIKNNLYTYLLQKREETAVAYASTVSDSRTVDEAESDPTPVKPVKPMIYILFGLLGLLFPIGLIASHDGLNNRVRSRGEVEKAIRVPIMGELAKSHERKALVISARGKSMIAEQIRTLRANLQYQRADSASQVVLVTSSISGEGKSFISLNLGASLALVDRPTVILEMDLRIPKLHQALNLDNSIGISDYLAGEATLDEVIKPMPGYKNYFIITSGNVQDDQNAAELLSSPRLGELIKSLREQFEYVLIDTPPVGIVSDAQLIAPFADTTLYIVRHDTTPKSYLNMVDTLHREQRFKNVNIVLNAVGGNEAYYVSGSHKSAYYGHSPRKKWLLNARASA